MNEQEQRISLAGIGLAFGTALGYVFGSLLGNAGLGITLGAAFGLLFSPVITQKKK